MEDSQGLGTNPLSTAWWKGWFHPGVRRSLLRALISPWRARMLPTVLGTGHSCSGSCSPSQATSFLGPQVGWARRAATSRDSILAGVFLGWE